MKLGQLVQKLMGGGGENIHTDTMVISKVCLFSFTEREQAKKKSNTYKLQQ
jgi:hypothetical protein